MIFAPPMVLANAAFVALFGYLYRFYTSVAVDPQRLVMVSISPIVASFSSFLIGLESIRAFSRVGTFTDAFRHKQTQFARAVHALIAIERFTMTIAVTVGVSFFMACLSTTLLLLARYRVFVTPGTAGVTLAYASLISFRIPAMFLMSSALERLLAAIQRIVEYTDLTPEEPPPPKGAAAAAPAGGVAVGRRRRAEERHTPLLTRAAARPPRRLARGTRRAPALRAPARGSRRCYSPSSGWRSWRARSRSAASSAWATAVAACGASCCARGSA